MPSRGDREFANALRRAGMADERDVKACMAVVRRVEDGGRVRLLPEVMVARGLMSRADVEEVLALIQRTLAYCANCGTQAYAPEDFAGGTACHWCGGELKRRADLSERRDVPSYVAHFRILRKLGEHDTATVYKAVNTTLERTVRLKVFAETAEEQEATDLKRALTEARVAARLEHPNVVRVFHCGREGGQRYIEMEYVEGFSLRQLLDEKGAMPSEEAMRIVRQIALALGAAHGEGLIHRHVRPENVLIGRGGVAKLTDFSLAKFSGLSAGASILDAPLDMAHYVPPEAVLNEVMDERSDIYSLGVTFYEMVTGRLPFRAPSGLQVMKMHCESSPEDPHAVDELIPEAVAEVILKMLAKHPPERVAGARALVTALDKVMSVGPRNRLALLRHGNVRTIYTVPAEGGTIARGPGNSVVLCTADPARMRRRFAVGREPLLDDLFTLRPWGGLGQMAGKVHEMIVDELGGRYGMLVNEEKAKRHVARRGDVLRVSRNVFVCLTLARTSDGEGKEPLGWLEGETLGGKEIRLLPVGEAPVLLGSSPEADVVVQGEGVADFHLQIVAVKDRAQATLLNVEPPRRVALSYGDKVRLGPLRLRYKRVGTRKETPAERARFEGQVPAAMMETVPGTPPTPRIEGDGRRILSILQEESERIDRETAAARAEGEKRAVEAAPHRVGGCRLTAKTGPRAGECFSVVDRPVIIGRAAECDIALMDAAVSRRHAQLIRTEGETEIVDMNSSNGVYVNGTQVRRQPLHPGDTVRIGSTEFLVHL